MPKKKVTVTLDEEVFKVLPVLQAAIQAQESGIKKYLEENGGLLDMVDQAAQELFVPVPYMPVAYNRSRVIQMAIVSLCRKFSVAICAPPGAADQADDAGDAGNAGD